MALTPRDAPLSRPLREVISPTGVADLTVPPGSYLLTAVADGLGTDYRKPVVIRPRAAPIMVSLSPEFKVNGLVTDAEGNPISSARIAHASAVPPPPIGTLSLAAIKAFGARLHTTTDANGNFQMVVSTSRLTPLLVEAPGYAPVWVVYDPAGPQRNQVVDVTLRKGSSLKAILDRIDPEAVISVAPKTQNGQSVPAIAQSRMWGREATAGIVTWDSLPPGDYRVMATFPNPVRFATPLEVGNVTLTLGASAELRVKLPPTPAPQSTYTRFFVPAATLPVLHAFARKKGGGLEEARHSDEETAGGKVIYIAGITSPTDAYVTTETELITASARRPGPNRQSFAAAQTTRVPRGDGKLHVNVPEGVTMPASAVQQLHDCTEGETITLAANVGPQGNIEVPLAVPCKVVTLQFENFAPLTLATSLEQGDRKWLGDHPLVPASTAEIHVVWEQSNTDAAGVVVQAMVRRGTDVRLIAVAEATANDEGRAVMKNVPAGEDVTFQARDPKTNLVGTAVARLEPGQRTLIDPLPIPELASLTVSPELDSDFKAEFPAAQILGITIMRENSQPIERKTVNFDKEITEGVFQEIAPGRWTMTVLVNVDGSKELLDADAVTVDSGDDKHVAPQVKPLIVHGQVLSGGEGVAASLSVGDAPGPNAIRRRVYTEEDGTFKVILPHSAIYYVQAQRISTGIQVDLGPLLFDGSLLRIDLPEGVLRVNVTRGGVPLGEAQVVAVNRIDNPDGSGVWSVTRRMKTDGAGTATLKGLSPGVWAVQASAPDDGGVAAKDATIAATGRADITLDIDESNVFEGIVRAANGMPAASASVECVFPATVTLQSARGDTGSDGRFEIHLPKPAPQFLQCGVTTVDGTISAFRSKVTRTAELQMPPSGGALTISDWGQRVIPDRFWLVSNDGALFNLSWVARKVGRMGAPLVISRLPAGHWTIVQVLSTAQLFALGHGTARSLPSVAELTVQPGQSTTITIQNVAIVANK